MTDFDIFDHGSFYTIDPMTSDCHEWIISNIHDITTWGNGFIFDSYAFCDVIDAIEIEGYTYSMHDKKNLYSEV